MRRIAAFGVAAVLLASDYDPISAQDPAGAPKPAGPQWEYQALEPSGVTGAAHKVPNAGARPVRQPARGELLGLTAGLNALAADGWELVAIEPAHRSEGTVTGTEPDGTKHPTKWSTESPAVYIFRRPAGPPKGFVELLSPGDAIDAGPSPAGYVLTIVDEAEAARRRPGTPEEMAELERLDARGLSASKASRAFDAASPKDGPDAAEWSAEDKARYQVLWAKKYEAVETVVAVGSDYVGWREAGGRIVYAPAHRIAGIYAWSQPAPKTE